MSTLDTSFYNLPLSLTQISRCIALSVSLLGAVSACVAAPSASDNKKAVVSAGVPIVIDAVVASVDEKPITLRELQARLSPPREISLASLPTDHDAQQTLDSMISERVLEAEAALKRVSVAETEVEEYINEVAARNSLSRADFEEVLKREGKNLDWYKRQVKSDILKSKIASTISRGGVSVSEQEIDEFLSSSPSFKSEGASLKLRVISIPSAGKSPEELSSAVHAIENALSGGESFENVAKKYSQGPHASEGGLLGVVAEKDLSSHIFDALLALEPGQHSKPVSTETETQIFFVEERYAATGSGEEDVKEEDLEARREEARKAIQKRKTDEKLSSYFAIEVNKNHTVDKKF
jgi:peptidyl-prolyl cis-trans isomerase SurA